jgi:hypothetical protein
VAVPFGEVGEVMPLVASKVAFRSATLVPPESRKANRMLTVSFESITPLGAPAPLSDTSADPAGIT